MLKELCVINDDVTYCLVEKKTDKVKLWRSICLVMKIFRTVSSDVVWPFKNRFCQNRINKIRDLTKKTFMCINSCPTSPWNAPFRGASSLLARKFIYCQLYSKTYSASYASHTLHSVLSLLCVVLISYSRVTVTLADSLILNGWCNNEAFCIYNWTLVLVAFLPIFKHINSRHLHRQRSYFGWTSWVSWIKMCAACIHRNYDKVSSWCWE